MTDGCQWRVRLGRTAEADFENILRWTTEHFGETQARVYAETLTTTIKALATGPDVIAAVRRNDIAKGLMTLHVARGGRRGRHFVIYRANEEIIPPAIDVLRLLHDSMDLRRHIDLSEESC